jgi:DNA-binding LacI/PurR family transcriptional regulator
MTLERLTLSRKIEHEIRNRIASGIYIPETNLPPERKLAKEFGTTRTTLGAALGRLEQDGLVIRTPGRGTRVLHPAGRLRKQLVGVIHGPATTSSLPSSQGSSEALNGAREILKELHYPFELASFSREETLHAEALSRFGALLFIEAGDMWQDLIFHLEKQNIPIVVAKMETDLDVTCTFVNHYEPRKLSVHNLVCMGHRRIGYIGRETGYGFYANARRGYEDGLQGAGIPVDENLIGICEKTDSLSGYLAARSLLQLSDPPTAIVAARDVLAEGACRAIEETGRRVGFDISIIGFDHMTWPAGQGFLTTYHEPCYEMGRAAAQMLAARVVNPSLPKEKNRFDTPFLLHRSAGPVPDGESPFQKAHNKRPVAGDA